MSVETLQNLEDLVTHKGWQWLMEQYEAFWGPARFLTRLEQIENDAKLSDTERRWHMQQAWASKKAIDGFIRLPTEEIAKTRRAFQTADSGVSRRGPGL